MKRTPIKVNRTSIKLPLALKAQLKLEQLQYETKDGDIHELIRHYEMLAAETLGKGGYSATSYKNPKEHRNWLHFEYVWEACRIKSWDAKLYIESQFDRCKKGYTWGQSKIPLPSHLYSENALRYFSRYLGNIRTTYGQDVGGRKKERGSVTQSVKQNIIDGIVTTADTLHMYLKDVKEGREQYKAMRVFQSWGTCSVYYLWSIPWFHKALKELPQNDKKVKHCLEIFSSIERSKATKELILSTVRQVEEHYGIPHNIDL